MVEPLAWDIRWVHPAVALWHILPMNSSGPMAKFMLELRVLEVDKVLLLFWSASK
jgi:hypothetical protein